MLDDKNILKQRDPQGALEIAAKEYEQAVFEAEIKNHDHDGRQIDNIILAGMGGSALAALIIQNWLGDKLSKPFEIVRGYKLPAYANKNSLIIVSSCSGNTEETLSCLDEALKIGAQITIATSGGKLLEKAQQLEIAHIVLPDRKLIEPRMTTIAQLRALTKLFDYFGLTNEDFYGQIAQKSDWLKKETENWLGSTGTDSNLAKQLALFASGKTAVFYGGELTSSLAYKWKISWNENSKNTAFCNEYPEFNHNEFLGWASHPVEKPFAVFDIISHHEHPQVLKRFKLSDQILSGRRPKAHIIRLPETDLIGQLLWGCVLADFASIYLAVINGVNPTPVELIEKLKSKLV